MRYRLEASLDHPNGCDELLNVVIPKERVLQGHGHGNYSEFWRYAGKELSTPAGLPIAINVNAYERHGLELIVAGRTILDMGVANLMTVSVKMLLPTDEVLNVAIREERVY